MNKEYILSNLPDGYVYLAEGEDMPEISYYIFTDKKMAENKLKDINNWLKYERTAIGEKRNKDTVSIFIKAAPAPAPAKLQYKFITNVTVGDLFIGENGVCGVIITGYGYNDFDEKLVKYSISGLNNSLDNYSNGQGISKEDMLKHLNNMKYIFITNINDKIKKTFEAARKLV
jgi:hypothetical protein